MWYIPYIHLARLLLTILVFVWLLNKRTGIPRSDRGFSVLLSGYLLLVVATIFDCGLVFDRSFFMLINDEQRALFNLMVQGLGYIPGIILTSVGLMRWSSSVVQLNTEVELREQAERALVETNSRLSQQAADLEILTCDLIEERRMAEESSRLKTELIHNISHELRTPLNSVIGFSELLTMRASNENEAEYARLILGSGRNLLGIVNKVIDIARLDARQYRIEKIPANPDDIIRDVAMAAQPLANAHNVEILLEPVAASSDWFDVDTRAISQALSHLVNNAIKYSPSGGQVRLSAQVTQDRKIRFVVTDQGPGIPEARLNLLAEPFVRAEGALVRAHDGAGLGLALCRRLAIALGGHLFLRNGTSGGIVATLLLPGE